jgi:hypothetical protein
MRPASRRNSQFVSPGNPLGQHEASTYKRVHGCPGEAEPVVRCLGKTGFPARGRLAVPIPSHARSSCCQHRSLVGAELANDHLRAPQRDQCRRFTRCSLATGRSSPSRTAERNSWRSPRFHRLRSSLAPTATAECVELVALGLPGGLPRAGRTLAVGVAHDSDSSSMMTS